MDSSALMSVPVNIREMPHVRQLAEWLAKDLSVSLRNALDLIDAWPYQYLTKLWNEMELEK